jgi:probable rRNA maturation factor
MAIRFFSEGINFQPREKSKVKKWLVSVINEELRVPGNINIIFCGDTYLADLNKAYLNHNTFTDILTFPFEEEHGEITGDIYLSIDRVKDNSEFFKQPFEKELARVMVHGVLHLLGFKDKSVSERKRMTEMENYYLEKLNTVNVSRGT